MSVLEVRDLRVGFPRNGGRFFPVDGVTFTLDAGEMLALVGESGSGKSLTCLSILRLLPAPGVIETGSVIRVGDTDVLSADRETLRLLRGGRVGMVFQDPGASLDPVYRAGAHVMEAIQAHRPEGRDAARRRAIDLLREVGVAPDRFDAYPHELSGGQRQRVMIAVALAAEPDVLIADEPTSALDVTVQAQILELLEQLRRGRNMAVLLVTHDLAVVAGYADRVAVMYGGRIVETGTTGALYRSPGHPYTQGLLAATPRLDDTLPDTKPIPGSVPTPSAWPPGCRFHPRCSAVMDRCRTDDPPAFPIDRDRWARCWLLERPDQ